MGFGDILDAWEKQGSEEKKNDTRKEEYRNLMDRWLEDNPAEQKDDDYHLPGHKSPSRKTIRRMAPQETLDLHGYTQEEAIRELTAFLKRSKKRGLKKVLIIHGKGNHSESGESVLRRQVRRFVAESPLCGEHGVPQPAMGGEGAVWVILR